MQVCDLTSGRIPAVDAALNGQQIHGADVITRIDYALHEPLGLERLVAVVLPADWGVDLIAQLDIKLRGLLAPYDGIEFDNSLGLVLQGEWISTFKNGRGQMSLGPRLVLQKFQVAHGGEVLGANALGFVASVAFR